MIYAVLILIAVGVTLNSVFKKHAPEKLACNRVVSKNVVEINEDFDVTLIVENRKLLPVTFLQVEERFHGNFDRRNKNTASIVKDKESLFHKSVMMLLSNQRVKRTYKLYPTKRGVYLNNSIRLMIGDMLGFSLQKREIDIYGDITVLPERYDIENRLTALGDYNGDISVRRWIMEDPVLTVGIREYTGLEPQKNIHWPSSLKSGRLMVKSFDYTTDNRAMVLLNIEAYKPLWMNIDAESIETVISIARAIVEEFEEAKIPYGYGTNAQMGGFLRSGDVVYPGLGQGHLYHILEGLGRINYGISCDFEKYLEGIIRGGGSYTTYVIITPVIFDEYVDYFNMLRKKCERLVVIALKEKNTDKLDEGIFCFHEGGEKS